MKAQIPIPQDITVASLADVFSVQREQSRFLIEQIAIKQSPPSGPWKAQLLDGNEWKFLSFTPTSDGRSLSVTLKHFGGEFSWDIINEIGAIFGAIVFFIATIATAIQGQLGYSAIFFLITGVFIGAPFIMRAWNKSEHNEDIARLANVIFELCRQLHPPATAPATPTANQPIVGVQQ